MKISNMLSPSQLYFTCSFESTPHDTVPSATSHTSPRWGMSLRVAGNMRFRWNETNKNRDEFFARLCKENLQSPAATKKDFFPVQKNSHHAASGEKKLIPVPVQLDHTRIVYDVKNASDTFGKIGDGIITKNKLLIPTVTVADCMPIFMFDPVTEVFGIVHSGWKGTGIIEDAIKLAKKNYGARPSDFRIVLGPHIHGCCYIVDEARAKYFSENFSSDCVRKISNNEKLPQFAWNNGNGALYRLSLEKANLSVLEKTGVREENITVCDDCTACNPIFGSNRRETAESARNQAELSQQNTTNKNAPQPFTVMAAFVMW